MADGALATADKPGYYTRIAKKEIRMSNDWIPGKREEILSMARKWDEVLSAEGARWNVTEDERSELNNLIQTAAGSINAAGENKGDRYLNAVAKESVNTLVAFMRSLKRRRLTIPPLSAPDYVLLDMREPDKKPTAHVVVHETVEFSARPAANAQIALDFRQAGSANKAKPKNCAGAFVVWSVIEPGEEIPKNPAGLTRHAMASRTPHILTFNESERGKTVAVSMAWQNARGILGAWAPMKKTVVP